MSVNNILFKAFAFSNMLKKWSIYIHTYIYPLHTPVCELPSNQTKTS
uniref:Uncharacterized protein n=1 Tax=Meloidogyne enterolobii TaxID=390850 RepID=A0A6V7VDS5_MELEN|nr:unnamed protein product [Meloidogyne enterolobii]